MASHTLICFGEDWGRHPSTTQLLIRHLLPSQSVIWINSLGWRRPRLRTNDLGRAIRKTLQAGRGVRRPEPHLLLYTPLVLPWYRSSTIRRLNARLVSQSLLRIVRRHHISDYSLMTTYPAAEGVFHRFPNVRRLYYCADEYTTLPGLDPKLVRSLEDSLLQAVDIVIAPSRALHDSKSRLHSNVVYLPHGVDFDHFAAASHLLTPIPPEIVSLPKPIIGFHGLVQELIDFDMIDAIARERPTWSIVLVGRRNFDVVALPARPNIHYLGERPYADIPRYLKGFDVCLIPYSLVPRTLFANPV